MSNVIEKIEELLKREWTEEDRKIIDSLQANIKYYKKFIPKAVIEDIMKAIDLCGRIKDNNDILVSEIELLKQKVAGGDLKITDIIPPPNINFDQVAEAEVEELLSQLDK